MGSAGEPAFQNGWTNSGTHVAFYRDPFGIVHLEGIFISGIDGAAAFTLPIGYRPSTNGSLAFVGWQNNAPLIDVNTDGTVLPHDGAFSTVTLSGISFRAV